MSARLRGGWSLIAHSLSGRLLLLTLLYLLSSEVLIFLPAIGLYHRELLDDHILSAELAILPFTEPGGQGLSESLQTELLKHANASAVMLKRSNRRDLYQAAGLPQWIDRTIDLTSDTLRSDIVNGLDCLVNGGERTLHVIAPTHIKGAQSIGIVLGEMPIKSALVVYARRVVAAALFISGVTAALVYASLFFFFVRPMRRITYAMVSFHENPEDAGRIFSASRRADEIGIAERELAAMQRDLYGFLRQKARLAALGAAVARIQHDLRNILANAQLTSDRLGASEDPVVKRLAPSLVASIGRAIALATSTLKYGRAEEPAPQRTAVPLRWLVDEVSQSVLGEDASYRIRQLRYAGCDDRRRPRSIVSHGFKFDPQRCRCACLARRVPDRSLFRQCATKAASRSTSRTTVPVCRRPLLIVFFSPSPRRRVPAAQDWGLPLREIWHAPMAGISTWFRLGRTERSSASPFPKGGERIRWLGIQTSICHSRPSAPVPLWNFWRVCLIAARPTSSISAADRAIRPRCSRRDGHLRLSKGSILHRICWQRPPNLRFVRSGCKTILQIGCRNIKVDVIFANAAFQWVADHRTLLPRLMSFLDQNGTLAFQVPRNFDEPCHTLIQAVAREGSWASKLKGVCDWGHVCDPKRIIFPCSNRMRRASTFGKRAMCKCSRARTRFFAG